jgi:hypothetical protein
VPALEVTPFRLGLVDEGPWPHADPASYPDHAPASVHAEGSRLRVAHRRYLAELDLETLEGRLRRGAPEEGAVDVSLRVALLARLPSLGMLPLHAAGLVLDSVGLAFFGPSGAGKSTLARLSPWPVLSDELVAVAVSPPKLVATGFWGEMDAARRPPSEASLATLVELARGDAFRLERLDPGAALRRLLGVLLVPPLAPAWREAVALAGRAAREVPVYRMEWTPAQPPWDGLRAALFTDGERQR